MSTPNGASPNEDVVGEIVDWVLSSAVSYRVELVLLALLSAGWWGLEHLIAPVGAAAVVGVVVVALLVAPASRRAVTEQFTRAYWRRRLERGFVAVTQDHLRGRVPRVAQVRRTTAGVVAVLYLRPGSSSTEVAKVSEHLAAALNVRSVSCVRDPSNAGRMALRIALRDPLSGESLRWPDAAGSCAKSWAPTALGVDEQGDEIAVDLVEHHLLIGGESGAGKSGALAVLLASLSRDQAVELFLLDGKLVELAAWQDCAQKFSGPDLPEAAAVLSELRTEMGRRYKVLLTQHKRKIDARAGLALLVLVIDELALYVNHPDRKAVASFCELLWDLLARGRAAGVIVVAATQKPAADVIPSSIRDLFGYRLAFRCTTRDASDTILGAGWAAKGYSAAEIDPDTRGVGLLLGEGGLPVRLRTYWLDDSTISAIAGRAAALRRGATSSSDGERT